VISNTHRYLFYNMSIINAQKFGRRFAVPLILFWILFQGMVFCAALLNNVTLLGASAVHHHEVQQSSSHAMGETLYLMDHGNTTESVDTACCDDQGDYVTSTPYSLLMPLLIAFSLFVFVLVQNSKSKCFNYFRDPPPRFNYPRNHLVNCTFLD
jgi:hypothetical protein